MLKQITASLIYPEDEIGKKFWKRVYEQAARQYGTTNIPVNTFNKVWIVPEKAVVYENAKTGTAYVVESKLKVMLEQDYLSLEKHEGIQSVHAQANGMGQLGSQIVREIVIPELNKEVNTGKNFYQLRQVVNSLILANWYKKKIKDSILAQVYEDKNKVSGINMADPKEKQKIYERYLKAFKKGVYSYIKEEQDVITRQLTPRKYFSGGIRAVIARTEYTDHVPSNDLPVDHSLLLESVNLGLSAAPVDKAQTALFSNVPSDSIDTEMELVRLSGAVYGRVVSENLRDIHGHEIQRDFIESMLKELIFEASKINRKVESIEMLIEMSVVFNAIGFKPGFPRDTYGSPNFKDYLPQIKSIVNAKDLDEVKVILGKITPSPVRSQPITTEFITSIKENFDGMPKISVHKGQKDDGIIQVIDLGSPEVQGSIKVPIIDVKPDNKILTLMTDEELLARSREWARDDKDRRIVVSRDGTLHFSKRPFQGGNFRILYPYRLDFEDSGLVSWEKVLGRIPERFQKGLMEEKTKAFDTLMRSHADAQNANLLLRIELNGEGKPDLQVESIDNEGKPSRAMLSGPGGIDLSGESSLSVEDNGQEIKFHLDPGMLKQLQNVHGFTPDILTIQPMTDIKTFLGLADSTSG
jgi:hypothetical protein